MIIHFDSVPFYSQFKDIPAVEWQKEGCGIASLAMEIEYYKPKSVSSLTTLILQALDFGAYTHEGWKHKELASLAGLYGLEGKNYDLSALTNAAAFDQFEAYLAGGPVIVSIHNKFDPRATLGHLVVVTGIDGDTVTYHDPASGNKVEKTITVENFLRGWKKRWITVRERAPRPMTPQDYRA